MCCHPDWGPITCKADIAKVLWNKNNVIKMQGDKKKKKCKERKWKKRRKAYLIGKSGKVSWGKMEDMWYLKLWRTGIIWIGWDKKTYSKYRE